LRGAKGKEKGEPAPDSKTPPRDEGNDRRQKRIKNRKKKNCMGARRGAISERDRWKKRYKKGSRETVILHPQETNAKPVGLKRIKKALKTQGCGKRQQVVWVVNLEGKKLGQYCIKRRRKWRGDSDCSLRITLGHRRAHI